MTQENKELLLKDLCARLPYKTIVQIDGCGAWTLRGIDNDNSAKLRDRVIVWYGKNQPSSKNSFQIIDCKPYLFPLSSMIEEQCNEFFSYYHNIEMAEVKSSGDYLKAAYIGDDAKYSWLNKNHFDYRGLIERGLAIDATGLNVYCDL